MVFNYSECIELYGSHYALMKAIKDKRIFKVKNGIYSTDKKPRELEIFIKEHKDAIFTMESAFYYLGISDVVPNNYVVATDKDASKYKDNHIRQYFMNNGLIKVGATTIKHNGIDVPVFDKERMLIEIIRYRNKIPFDYYKDIINYYRNHIYETDFSLISEYLESFPRKQLITNIIRMEIL